MWMVRPVILIGLTGTILWLALHGSEKAIEAILIQFATLAGAYFGERSALKVPGTVAEKQP